MALKQILFSEDSFSKLPEIIHLLQSKTFPESALVEVFSNVSTLIYGSYTQRKIGLAVLKCCLLYLHKNNKMSQNIDYLLKWWKGVVNCMKSRYTADCTYRLACTNAIILAQISSSYVDLQMEGRSNVPVMVSAAVSHLCAESFELLLTLARHYPSHAGKVYEEIRAFCLAHVQDEYCEKAGELLGRMACVGPAGKQSTNYIQSWSKVMGGCVESLKGILIGVVGQSVTEKPQFLVLQSSEFTGEFGDIIRLNKEITFISKCLKSLFEIAIEAPMTFPLKSFKSLLEMMHTVYSETILYSSTSENFVKKSIINHAISSLATLLTTVVPTLHTTAYLIQPTIEKLCFSMIQQSHDCLNALKLLNTLVGLGCSLHTVPYVSLMDFLTLQSLQIKGPVSKKQKTEQFNTFSFETSTLGVHDEEKMIETLKIMNQILKSCGCSLPALKPEILRSKCNNIISNKTCFSTTLIQLTYETLINLSRQSFDVQSVLSLSAMSHDTSHRAYLNTEIMNVEPHLHPERFSFRQSEAQQSSTTLADDVPSSLSEKVLEAAVDDMWNKENSSVFEESRAVGAESEEEEGMLDQTQEEEEEMDTSLIGDSDLLEKIKADYVKIKESAAPPAKEPLKDITNTSVLETAESEQLFDILSAFVDAPVSGDEA